MEHYEVTNPNTGFTKGFRNRDAAELWSRSVTLEEGLDEQPEVRTLVDE